MLEVRGRDPELARTRDTVEMERGYRCVVVDASGCLEMSAKGRWPFGEARFDGDGVRHSYCERRRRR